MVTLLVGPWHVLVHSGACQQRYNPRLLKGTGMTFGDLPEHLWASLRKYLGSLAYMGNADRDDFICILVGARYAVARLCCAVHACCIIAAVAGHSLNCGTHTCRLTDP